MEAQTSDLINKLRNATGLFGRPDWKTRLEAAEKLGQLRDELAVGDLIGVIDERKNEDLCRAAVGALGQTGSEEAIQALERLLSAPGRKDIHVVAVVALAQIDAEPATQALARVSSDPTRRQMLIESLRNDLGKASRFMVKADWGRRAMAAQGLGILRATEAVDDLTMAISKNDNAELWTAVIATLAQIGDDRALTALIGGWEWANAIQSDAIRQTLVAFGPMRIDQPLIDALGHRAARVQDAAWQLLAQTEILPRLKTALEDPNREAHLKAQGQLVQIGERAVPDLMDLLGHSSSQVRQLTASALAQIGGQVVGPLVPILRSWGQTPDTPRAVLVAPDGSGEFRTLAEAVDEALPGGIIRLATGEHRVERLLHIEKPLALLGAGMEQSRVIGERIGCIISVHDNPFFVATDVTFEHVGSWPTCVAEVSNEEVSLHRCRFTGGSVGEDMDQTGNGPEQDDDAFLEHHMAHIFKQLQGGMLVGHGLRLLGAVHGTVAACECVKNEQVGIMIEGETQLTLEGNTCRENRIGIAYFGSAAGVARQNQCTGNTMSGIQITGQAQPVLEGNICQANQAGIIYGESAGGTARQNRCVDNALSGIMVKHQAQPTLEGNTIQGNKGGGISYFDSAAGLCRQNQCVDNKVNGIQTAGQSCPTLDGNTIEGSESSGILVNEEARPTLQGNVCRRNAAGIFYSNSSSGIARQNHCTASYTHGIQVESQAQPVLEENNCEKNGYCGIAYFDSATGFARKNLCVSNGVAGILVNDRAQPTLEGNTCQGNQHDGIAYASMTAGSARGNHCLSNGANGVLVSDQARPKVTSNICRGNNTNGILVTDQAQPVLEENTCQNNQNGIAYADDAGGLARKNTCTGNLRCGIIAMPTARPVLQDNQCRGNKERDVLYPRGY